MFTCSPCIKVRESYAAWTQAALCMRWKTQDFCKEIAKDVDMNFDKIRRSKDGNRPSPIGRNKKVIGLIKCEL